MKREQAVLLSHFDLSVEGKKVGKLLDFFGVPWRTLTIAQFLADTDTTASHSTAANSRLFCSAEAFLRLIERLECNPGGMRCWAEHVHSVFVHAGDDCQTLRQLTGMLVGDDQTVVREIDRGVGDLSVSDQFTGFCGVMSGIRFPASTSDVRLGIDTSSGNAINIVSIDQIAAFVKLDYQAVPVFLTTATRIVDIGDKLAVANFDIRDHFLSAVPVVLYVKWAFAESCWHAPEANACLVIDDPLLKSSYGFVNFQELLSLMESHRFSTNIAFIPWNWMRSTPEVVRLFRENPGKYSISVHGCDHSRAEFGSRDRQRLYWKAKQAVERMTHHESITGIRHDRVMVFPQGVFSEAAMSVLKHTELIGAVNNDVISDDQQPRAITVSEVWDVAVMSYSNFPIFTRRYPWEGVENFAFDILLGKPCIVVIHHDFCRDGYAHLVEFVDKLNALKCPLSWRSLGEVVQRSCRQRKLSSGVLEMEMYGTELRVKNRSDTRKRFIIRRRESDPSAIEEICAEPDQVAWNFSTGRIAFEIELNPGENRTVRIRFHDLSANGRYKENVGYRVKTMMRRYLCEARDNYVVKYKPTFLLKASSLTSRRGVGPSGPKAVL